MDVAKFLLRSRGGRLQRGTGVKKVPLDMIDMKYNSNTLDVSA